MYLLPTYKYVDEIANAAARYNVSKSTEEIDSEVERRDRGHGIYALHRA